MTYGAWNFREQSPRQPRRRLTKYAVERRVNAYRKRWGITYREAFHSVLADLGLSTTQYRRLPGGYPQRRD